MKTSVYKLESLILTIGLLLISLTGSSQDSRISKEDKKAAKHDVDYFNYQVIDSMIQSRSFVIEADWLENQYGNRTPVTSDLNFIMVDSTNAVLQTGSSFRVGSNGLGGATAEGAIQGLKVTKNSKNLSFYLRFSVMTNIGIYDIAMTIYSDRNARAVITGLTRGKLVYDGHIETLYNSNAYKGRNSI